MGVKGKKEKKARKRNVANELDTVTYEQQILDNNRQLARLRSRNEELELEAEKLKDKLLQLEENKADLTSHLQRILQRKVEEAEELQERLLALEKLRKDEQKANKMKIERMEQEFKTMENNLSAEIKLAAGKLNALEDFRLARIDLMNKFEEQEKRVAEQELRHKESLYEAEKSLIIGKAK
uniref:Cilia- and flagella-associated protein 157 n=2 Tax=Trichogramma TaxID=7490 RepID=A0ABD2WZN0_9HYME